MRERFEAALQAASAHGQGHIFRFWETLSEGERLELLAQAEQIDFALMRRLAEQWIFNPPAAEHFARIEPVPMIPGQWRDCPEHAEALASGEAAMRAGQVGIFLVAGGQGTRLGYDGPKGAYAVGPLTGKSIFAYHAEKIRNLQTRYGAALPWYIMVSDTNEQQTRDFFAEYGHFGLDPANVFFFRQRMVPCMDQDGRFMLEAPGRLAMNPNGHGGSIPALVENGILEDARKRGVRYLSYFQVDNWAVQLADPLFIGYHVLRNPGMSSKNHVKSAPREAVGVHCLCDGEYRVIEYSELDIYPQLLEMDAQGELKHRAGNPAIHILSVDFVQRIYDHFDQFPWHLAHKRIAFLDESGQLVQPAKPNGYKFETFVFDALRFVEGTPVALEIAPQGEYTPIKQFDGDNSVVAARQSMSDYWAGWIEAAGGHVPRDAEGHCAVSLEISPIFAWTRDEFVAKIAGKPLDITGPSYIDDSGAVTVCG